MQTIYHGTYSQGQVYMLDSKTGAVRVLDSRSVGVLFVDNTPSITTSAFQHVHIYVFNIDLLDKRDLNYVIQV